MIERATERRLAGDWRGACAAANVDVAFDLAEVAQEHGGAVAAALEDDLRHLAPDLLRWHAPRVGRGRTTITPDQRLVLARPGAGPGDDGGGDAAGESAPYLYVSTPRWMVHGPQRLTLRFGALRRLHPYLETDWAYLAFWRDITQSWATSRHLWDVRHAAELRERCGGGVDRAPFLDSTGTPRAPAEPPAADPGRADPAAHTERVTTLHESGEVEAAFAAAGIELDAAPFDLDPYFTGRRIEPLELLARMPLALTRLEPEVRRLVGADPGKHYWIPCTQHVAIVVEHHGPAAALRVRAVSFEREMELWKSTVSVLPEVCWRRLPDLDLLRYGHTSPDDLHPLVREALCPGRRPEEDPAGTGVPGLPARPVPPVTARVRCRGEWHEVTSRDGALRLPHSDEEQQREHAMRAFGGASGGCFAVEQAWTSGTGRLPKVLHERRQELFARAQHGDTPVVLELLDAGFDPHVRDRRQRTLLHVLHLLDHEALLPRLLAAGLDLEATDREGRTPLYAAVCEDGSVDLVRALLTAGARIDVVAETAGDDMSLYRLLDWHVRDDLDFLQERIELEHPHLTEEE